MKGSKTIRDELLSYNLPDSIKMKAIDIYDSIKDKVGTCRSNIRKQLLYFLIHNAYLETGHVPIQSEIIQTVNLDDSSISKALKMFSWPRTSYRMQNDDIKPEDFIPHYVRVLKIREDSIPMIIKLCKKWTNHQQLEKIPVIVLTAAVLKYYMDISGLVIDWKSFTTVFNLSKVVIENGYTLISQLDNQ